MRMAVYALLASALCAVVAFAADTILVREGKPTASIVIAQNPTLSARLSALELQYHFRKITGALVPIRTDDEEISGSRILVGDRACFEQ